MTKPSPGGGLAFLRRCVQSGSWPLRASSSSPVMASSFCQSRQPVRAEHACNRVESDAGAGKHGLCRGLLGVWAAAPRPAPNTVLFRALLCVPPGGRVLPPPPVPSGGYPACRQRRALWRAPVRINTDGTALPHVPAQARVRRPAPRPPTNLKSWRRRRGHPTTRAPGGDGQPRLGADPLPAAAICHPAAATPPPPPRRRNPAARAPRRVQTAGSLPHPPCSRGVC